MSVIWSISSGCPAEVPRWAEEGYKALLPYVASFLVAKHPHRKGVVCPFVPRALKDDEIYFSYPSGNTNIAATDIGQQIKHCIEYYKARKSRVPGSVIIIFPQDFDIKELFKVHIANKESCIKEHLMLGVMYDKNAAPSLHSQEFFPLRTPVPILVIRDLTISDLVFLDPDHYSVQERYKFLSAFIEKFDEEGMPKNSYAALQIKQAKEMRDLYGSQAKANYKILSIKVCKHFYYLVGAISLSAFLAIALW